jgi:hypothetical protein
MMLQPTSNVVAVEIIVRADGTIATAALFAAPMVGCSILFTYVSRFAGWSEFLQAMQGPTAANVVASPVWRVSSEWLLRAEMSAAGSARH